MADWNMESEHPLKVDPVPNVVIKRGPLRSFLVTKPSEDLSSLRTVTSSKEKLAFNCFSDDIHSCRKTTQYISAK